MAKMIIMRGLPGSGKTTRAKEIMEKDGNVVRVNKDSLREMLHFGKWSGNNEDSTRLAAKTLARMFLAEEVNIIIDDTNLNEKTFQGWKALAKECSSKVELIEMTTLVEECIHRDNLRVEGHVGSHVILGMAMQNGLYPKPEKGIVIVDIDGTLANIEHRKHFVIQDPKDHKSFFANMKDDELRVEILSMVMKFEEEGYEIFLVSGRPEEYREVTEAWLEKKAQGYKFYKELFMRPKADHRPDTQVKEEIYNRYFKNYSIFKVIDDRPSVIRMWKEQGLDVIDVGEGIEF